MVNIVPLFSGNHQLTTTSRTIQKPSRSQPRFASRIRKTRAHPDWAVTAVLHSMKGRVRLKVPALKRHPVLAQPLETFLRALPGIRGVWANQNCASLTITFDPKVWSAGALSARLNRLSSDTLRAVSKAAGSSMDRASQESEGAGFELVLSTAGLACLAAEFLAAPLIPLLLLGSALPMFARAFDAFGRRDALTVDVLDASATALLACQGQLPMALFMVWLVNLGDYIRDVTIMQAQDAVTEVLAYRRTPAWVVREGKTAQIEVDKVQIGETVVVYPGERIPIDGTVLKGSATVDQQALTGESLPVEKTAGHVVHAATVVQDGKLYVRAERVGNDTEAARIVRMVQDAPAHETRVQNYAERWANELVPYSFAAAGARALMSQSLASSASVLIIDYGTGIRIAAPTTVLASMTRAIRHGILIKGAGTWNNSQGSMRSSSIKPAR